jgi:hypothetical protein
MNYKRIYDQFINRALSENRKKYKKADIRYICFEKHHIIPKCLGGNNLKENLVLLTPEEHLLLHLCLVKMHPNNHSLIKAAMLMSTDRYGNRINNKHYGWVRRACSLAPSPTKGKPSKRKGRIFGDNNAKGKPNGKKGISKGKPAWNKGLVSPLKGIPRGPQKKITCTVCGLEGGVSNMKKYHFENCKR